jgi:predicted DNA-binding protein (UPF0251 family)/DNA-directed RNA polymerase subunit RPC12/RpoP
MKNIPTVLKFSPSDTSQSTGENSLKLEELEAIRLKDLIGLDKKIALNKWRSHARLSSDLLSRREKNRRQPGQRKSIQIEGGHYTRNICPVRCLDCGREWSESLEEIEQKKAKVAICPKCRSKRLRCCPDDDSEQGEYCSRQCR